MALTHFSAVVSHAPCSATLGSLLPALAVLRHASKRTPPPVSIPSSWGQAGPCDFLLINRIWQKWQNSLLRLQTQRLWVPQCTHSVHFSSLPFLIPPLFLSPPWRSSLWKQAALFLAVLWRGPSHKKLVPLANSQWEFGQSHTRLVTHQFGYNKCLSFWTVPFWRAALFQHGMITKTPKMVLFLSPFSFILWLHSHHNHGENNHNHNQDIIALLLCLRKLRRTDLT